MSKKQRHENGNEVIETEQSRIANDVKNDFAIDPNGDLPEEFDDDLPEDFPETNRVGVDSESFVKPAVKLCSKVKDLKAELESRLSILKHQKQLADHREVFLSKKTDLEKVVKTLLKSVKEFETQNFRLVLKEKGSSAYNDSDCFGISNPELILKFVRMLVSEIDSKIKAIENELLSA